MKTKIITLVTFLVVVLGISNLTYAASNNTAVVTTLTNISAINKIEVHGNVELFVSDGDADQVKVHNKYYSESALVQSTNGVLRISSYTAEKLVVWVTANDLRSIAAYDNAEVRSFGSLSKIDLNVDLHNNASARLNIDAYAATVTVNDHASADLTGNATELNLSRNYAASVNKFNFNAANITENKINFPAETKGEDVAGI